MENFQTRFENIIRGTARDLKKSEREITWLDLTVDDKTDLYSLYYKTKEGLTCLTEAFIGEGEHTTVTVLWADLLELRDKDAKEAKEELLGRTYDVVDNYLCKHMDNKLEMIKVKILLDDYLSLELRRAEDGGTCYDKCN